MQGVRHIKKLDQKSDIHSPTATTVHALKKQVKDLHIEFLYLNLTVCERCMGTEKSLNEAIKEIRHMLDDSEISIRVDKIHVRNKEQATKLGFIISPTIRINGKDIQPDFKESRCDYCMDISCCSSGVNCRVWVHEGREYNIPPKAIIVDAILHVAYNIKNDSTSFKTSMYANGKDIRGSQTNQFEDSQNKETDYCCSDLDNCCP